MNVCHGFAYVLKYLGNLSFYSPCWAHHKFLEAHWIDINTFIIRSVASEGWVPEFPLSLSDSLTSLLFWVKIESILSNTKNCQQSLSVNKWVLFLSGECVISLVLSRHNKNLKWRVLKASRQTMFKLLDRSVLQLHVTAQFYLENKGKYILEPWGHANPKDSKRREREIRRERESKSTCTRERDPQPFGSSFFSFHPSGPAVCKLG